MDRNFHIRDTATTLPRVALRKESVDRNWKLPAMSIPEHMSLSARRAWIEIASSGVDFAEDWRRSPQGERG